MRKNEEQFNMEENTQNRNSDNLSTENTIEEKRLIIVQPKTVKKWIVAFVIVDVILMGIGISLCTSNRGSRGVSAIYNQFSYVNDNIITFCEHSTFKWNTANNRYSNGASAVYYQFMHARDNIITLYKGDAITYEQLKNYEKNYLNLIELSKNSNNISSKDIENYNKSIKEIFLLDYKDYYFESTGRNYINGIQDAILVILYKELVKKALVNSKISDEQYNAFMVVFNNYTGLNNYNKESLIIIIDYSRDLLKKYVGDPDELLKSAELEPLINE